MGDGLDGEAGGTQEVGGERYAPTGQVGHGWFADQYGPEYTEREVADRLAQVLGRPLRVVTIPQPGWVDAMLDVGLPASMAHELAALYNAGQQGLLVPRGDRTRTCTTPIDETLRHLLAAVGSPTPTP